MSNWPRLAPELKSWLDNVVVPALVEEYVAELQEQEAPCSPSDPVAECGLEITATVERKN